MDFVRNPGRAAGLVYLLLVLIGPFYLVYVPSQIYVQGNLTATAEKVSSHESLLRLGIVAELVGSVIFLFVALSLYRLLHRVDEPKSKLMVILTQISVAVGFVNSLHYAGALLLARTAEFSAALDKPQREALITLFVRLHQHGNTANEIFWGLWLIPLGILVIKSGFLPRVLGYWLIVNGATYVALSITALLTPHYSDLASQISFPFLLGEVAFMLWLVIKGADPERKSFSVATA
ncbi:MAG TPA: DUF4386 domain-containing protein [Terriglobales bacterium]|nr:DUF4386 domain-containing protein [Terriglobales bacterium]